MDSKESKMHYMCATDIYQTRNFFDGLDRSELTMQNKTGS